MLREIASMLQPMKILIAFLIALTLAPYTVNAQGLVSGWMQGKGRTAVAITGFTESFDRYYVDKQQTYNPQLGAITTSGVSLYLSAGITDWLDVVANVPYVSASSSAGFWETISGSQDMQVGIKFRPLTLDVDRSHLSVIVAGVLATPISNYPNDAPVTIGHQASGVDGRIVAQLMTPTGVFAMAQLGYIARGRVRLDRGYEVDVPDAIDAVGRIGWGGSSWYADVWLHHLVPQSGTNIGPGVPFPSNAIGFTRVGGTLAYRVINELSVIGGVAGVLTGRNVGHSTRFTFGVAYDLPMWNGVSM